MANEEIKKPAAKEADDLFKALCLGTLRDSNRIEGTPRNPRWKRDKKKEKTHERQNSFSSQ
jgi:hypothetical protein